MKRKVKSKEIKELEDQLGIAEIFGRRVFWIRLGRREKSFYSTKNSNVGCNTLLYDMRYHKLIKMKDFKDHRRTCKYYYDWGEIDRLIYTYFAEKLKYRLQVGQYVEAKDLPDHIIAIRNDIVESLFNLIKTIIYTHSFHQQINDGDLFQDSAEKLIKLLDDDKHDPLRGTSFTFFTVALKNMIFTQIKKNKRYSISTDNIKPVGVTDSRLDEVDEGMNYEKDFYDLLHPSADSSDDIEKEFIDEYES